MTTISYTVHHRHLQPDSTYTGNDPQIIKAIEDQLKYYNLPQLPALELPYHLWQAGITITHYEESEGETNQ